MYLLCGAVCTWLLEEDVNFQIRAENRAGERGRGELVHTRVGFWAQAGSLGDQQRLRVRTRAGAIPLSQAGTSACLEGEACLTWPVYWVPGVNDSAVCFRAAWEAGKGAQKRDVWESREIKFRKRQDCL